MARQESRRAEKQKFKAERQQGSKAEQKDSAER